MQIAELESCRKLPFLQSKHRIEGPSEYRGLEGLRKLVKLNQSRFTFETCSVVGHSPRLLEYPYGSLIDSSTAVFRFNLGFLRLKSLGQTAFTGSHTTIAFITDAMSSWQEEGVRIAQQEGVVVVLNASIKKKMPAKFQHYLNTCTTCMVYDVSNVVAMGKNTWGKRTSTGLKYIPLFLDLCNEIRLFGFHWASEDLQKDLVNNSTFAKAHSLPSESKVRRQLLQCLRFPRIAAYP